MVAREKIDSNETSLFFAEEARLGVLPGEQGEPGVAEWHGLEPNEYDDMGGELTLLARNPINRSRQRKKGSVVDLDASGGFNQDFTYRNMQRIMQGFMFADFREKATTGATAATTTEFAVTDETGFAVGNIVNITGFNEIANSGHKLVTAVAAGEITVAGTVAETPATPGKIVKVGIQAAAGDITVDVSGTWPTLESTAFDFTTLGLVPGEWIFIGGDNPNTFFASTANNGFKRVRSVTANALVLDTSTTTMVTDAGAAVTLQIFTGRVLKNELDGLIKRRTYQIERQLGAPDPALPNAVQAEYIKGAVPSELSMNIEPADKINCDMSFVAIDAEQRTSTQNIKAGTRVPVEEADMYNTSSDFSALRLYVVTPGNANAAPLFGYLSSLTLSINNNLTVNKAVAVLGGFEVTAGTFEVSAEATAYFSTIEAVQAVRNNANAGLYSAVAAKNSGFVVDLPLAALGNARLDVEQDEPIMLPLQIDAATAALINPNTDYTLMWVFFDYLPTRAM